ncbi:MAG TPA: sigma-70 family RNA polymerase sigma factor [Planctomycetota bacterium]|nr:sigma-70 family RNA polymerase sigma factor [Planctomycetota bacterium]
MTEHARAGSIEHLLVHSDWLRALARRLVASDDVASDLEQETWLVAIEHPPPDASAPRGWLAQVLRNLVRQHHRSESARQAREASVARREADSGGLEPVDRAQSLRWLIEAVLELDEPYRTALLLRYQEGLTPESIAKRQGIPDSTVRNRIRRGLAQLRESLARRHGDAWSALLIPLFRREAAAPLAGTAGVGAVASAIAAFTSMATLKLVGVFSGVLLVGLLTFSFWRASPDEVQRDGLDPVDGKPATAALVTPQAASTRSSLSGAPAAPESVDAIPATAQHGRVVDDAFGLPVFSRIEPDVGSFAFSNLETGEFRLSEDCAGWTKLRASAEGFEEAVIAARDAQGDSGAQIRLHGARSCSVSVQYASGIPVIGASVTWRSAVEIPYGEDPEGWIDSRAQNRGAIANSSTDGAGLARLALGSPAIAVVLDPRTRIAKTIKVRPGEDALVVLPEDVLSLRFVDPKSGGPVQGLELDTWCPREINAMAETACTDADGNVTIAPTSFPTWIRCHGTDASLSELLALSEGPQRSVRGMIRIDAPSTEALLVGVRTSGAGLRLIDDASGLPIDGLVRIVSRLRSDGAPGSGSFSASTLWSPRTSSLLWPRYRSRAGRLPLPVYLHNPEELVRGVDATETLVIVATGYHPCRVLSEPDAEFEADGTRVLRLKPAAVRSLRLLRPDGRAYTGNMCLYSPDEDVMVLSSASSASGVYGPFDLLGSSLELGIRPGRGPKWTLSSAELEANEVVSFTIPIQAGAIVVEGIPASAARIALIADSEESGERWPDATEPGSSRFHSLPAGSYLVGPREWVRGAKYHTSEADAESGGLAPAGNTSLRVRVRPGETGVVRWRDMWGAGRNIEGRVRVLSPARIEPFLVPFYGAEGGDSDTDASKIPLMIFGRRAPRIELARDGHYQIAATEPLPRLIAVCVADEEVWGHVNGLHVLEVIKPGESADIPTGSVELSWKGDPARDLLPVVFEIQVASLRHPLNSFHRASENLWSTDRVLHLDGIPMHVKQLAIAGQIQPIELEPDKLVRIEVDIAVPRIEPKRR